MVALAISSHTVTESSRLVATGCVDSMRLIRTFHGGPQRESRCRYVSRKAMDLDYGAPVERLVSPLTAITYYCSSLVLQHRQKAAARGVQLDLAFLPDSL